MPAELHLPERPILTFKELLIHLGTITLGILIALSLEGVVEWRHHRALVQEARENLDREIRDNRAELEKLLRDVPKRKSDNEKILRVVGELLTKRKTDTKHLEFGYVPAQLSSASWRTAEATGALGYMPYTEVQKYAKLYDLQQQFVRIQDNVVDKYGASLIIPNFDKPVQEELLAWKRGIESASSSVLTAEMIGKGLLEAYSQASKSDR